MNEQTVFLEGKHVGVTGANGFLGSHICKLLLNKGSIIHAFVYPGTSVKVIENIIKESGGDITFIDITKPDTLKGKFKGIYYLFQIAGSVAEWAQPIKKIFDVNFRGSRNVHFYAKKAGVKRTVHTSTMAANGSCPDPYPAVTDENAPFDLQGTGPYSESKYLGDRVAEKYNETGVYETIRIRPHQVLGWGDTGPSAPGKIVYQTINRGFPFYIDQVTQIVHVEDVAEAHITAMERGIPGSVYNIASEKPINAYHFLCYISKVANVKPPAPIAIPKGILRILAFFLELVSTHITHKAPILTMGNAKVLYKNMGTSIERAKKDLGFKPRSWRKAVDDSVKWFLEGYIDIKRRKKKDFSR
jgi:dihydroflavonol-4-reductase